MYSHYIVKTFETHFNHPPKIVVRAPGRINLIGEHTDYNGGYVLPAAIDKAIYFAVSPRTDKKCIFVSHDLKDCFETSLDSLAHNPNQSWSNYLMGVLNEIKNDLISKNREQTLQGIELVFGGDLPSGGGISSSAAIENGIGFAVNEVFNLGYSRMDLVKISQQAENNFVGMKCGIMDMFSSMMGLENQVIRIDCRNYDFQYFPFEAPEMRLILCDTTVKHSLVDSEYNTRRRECEEGVALFHQHDPSVQSLRDVSFEVLKHYKNELREVVYLRCKYVIEEIARVEKACDALKINDFETFGQLMFQTHDGLQNEYEVSCPELDFLVQEARNTEGVLGARMMGGGFGGCTINLVKTSCVDSFLKQVKLSYLKRFNKDLPCHVVQPKNGVEMVDFNINIKSSAINFTL